MGGAGNFTSFTTSPKRLACRIQVSRLLPCSKALSRISSPVFRSRPWHRTVLPSVVLRVIATSSERGAHESGRFESDLLLSFLKNLAVLVRIDGHEAPVFVIALYTGRGVGPSVPVLR